MSHRFRKLTAIGLTAMTVLALGSQTATADQPTTTGGGESNSTSATAPLTIHAADGTSLNDTTLTYRLIGAYGQDTLTADDSVQNAVKTALSWCGVPQDEKLTPVNQLYRILPDNEDNKPTLTCAANNLQNLLPDSTIKLAREGGGQVDPGTEGYYLITGGKNGPVFAATSSYDDSHHNAGQATITGTRPTGIRRFFLRLFGGIGTGDSGGSHITRGHVEIRWAVGELGNADAGNVNNILNSLGHPNRHVGNNDNTINSALNEAKTRAGCTNNCRIVALGIAGHLKDSLGDTQWWSTSHDDYYNDWMTEFYRTAKENRDAGGRDLEFTHTTADGSATWNIDVPWNGGGGSVKDQVNSSVSGNPSAAIRITVAREDQPTPVVINKYAFDMSTHWMVNARHRGSKNGDLRWDQLTDTEKSEAVEDVHGYTQPVHDVVSLTPRDADWKPGETFKICTTLWYDPTPDGVLPDGSIQKSNRSDERNSGEYCDNAWGPGQTKGKSQDFYGHWYTPADFGWSVWQPGFYYFNASVTPVNAPNYKAGAMSNSGKVYREGDGTSSMFDDNEYFTIAEIHGRTRVFQMNDGVAADKPDAKTSHEVTEKNPITPGSKNPVWDALNLSYGTYPKFAPGSRKDTPAPVTVTLTREAAGLTAPQKVTKTYRAYWCTGAPNAGEHVAVFQPSDFGSADGAWPLGEYHFTTTINGWYRSGSQTAKEAKAPDDAAKSIRQTWRYTGDDMVDMEHFAVRLNVYPLHYDLKGGSGSTPKQSDEYTDTHSYVKVG